MQQITIGNKNRGIRLEAGCGRPVRLVASIGLSPDQPDASLEVDKAMAAMAAGADIINDDSIVEPMGSRLLERLLGQCSLPINTEPIFETVATQALTDGHETFSIAAAVETIEKQARMGIDIMTIHVAFSRALAREAARSSRIIRMTSRGGALVAKHMAMTGCENPYRVALDEILGILACYGVTLSLGTALRPATVVDGLDDLFDLELDAQREVADRARAAGVQVMLEGPGHLPYRQIGRCIDEMKAKTGGLPVRLLGHRRSIVVQATIISSVRSADVLQYLEVVIC